MTMTTREVLETAAAYIKEAIDQLPADQPEVPERIEQWPEDDTHLRGEFWDDRHGTTWAWRGREGWRVWEPTRRSWKDAWTGPHGFLPFTRTTDPSLPRTWDTLDDVPEDVELVTGDYVGMHREFARSGVCESGWLLLRLKGGRFRGWMELSADRTEYVKNIQEDQS